MMRRLSGGDYEFGDAALAREAQHRTWQWTRPMAMGDGTNLRLAQSVSPPARALRKASRYPRGIPDAWMCSNLLALLAGRLDDDLLRLPFFLKRVSPPAAR